MTALGTTLGDHLDPDTALVAEGVRRASQGIMHFGKAQVGDKTMVDVLVPFSQSLCESAQSALELGEAWGIAAKVAQRAAADTAQLRPRIGRARPLAEKSLGTPDAGAVSLSLIINAIEPLLRVGLRAPNLAEETVHG